MEEYTKVSLEDSLNEEQKRALGWKRCNSCGEMRPPEQYYKSKRTDGLSYSCRSCHRVKVRSYRKVEGSYNWFYRRLERLRRRAKKRGLECTLTVADFEGLKEETVCRYCKDETDMITLERLDNDKGYTPDNVIPVCYMCNKLKSNIPFTEKEMELIGRAVASYHKRMEKLVKEMPLDIEPIVL